MEVNVDIRLLVISLSDFINVMFESVFQSVFEAFFWTLALASSFSAHCELFPQLDRNAEPQSGVDQVTAEQSSFLNASVYP